MTLRLAHDQIIIAHGSLTVRMIPTLRAAYRLQRKHGLTRLMQGLDEGRLEIIRNIADECGDPITADKIIDRKFAGGFGRALASIQQPFADFLAACYGVDDDPNTPHHSETREQAGLGFDLTKALEDFFEIGTGWLGWTPADTWAATPAEILAAQRGLMARLKAIHGNAEDNTDHTARPYDPREEVSPEEVRAGLAKLKAEAGRGKQ
ncbi:phage tail assembly chaperone [Manganibacter manganicus]|uniref:Tail assembly chaperone n=1 Tax=Manganibacter manganicus TaxID=1873176 RepID=A0A1V8RNC6_9HYPH|nr:phage tail assembly chaperone [Pseudaminobacter manganicus]OQM74715.1 hypothetical protein BFN67_03500 [Pseudaminobacter manganicus]